MILNLKIKIWKSDGECVIDVFEKMGTSQTEGRKAIKLKLKEDIIQKETQQE